MRRLSLLLVLGLGLAAPGCRSTPKGPDVDDLMARLKSEDAAVSGAANLEVIRLGEPAVPGLVAMLQSGDVRLRKVAATTLWGLGAKGRAAVPDLAAMLEAPETELRLAAAMALDNMGPAAVDAVPALVKALRDPGGRGAAVVGEGPRAHRAGRRGGRARAVARGQVGSGAADHGRSDPADPGAVSDRTRCRPRGT